MCTVCSTSGMACPQMAYPHNILALRLTPMLPIPLPPATQRCLISAVYHAWWTNTHFRQHWYMRPDALDADSDPDNPAQTGAVNFFVALLLYSEMRRSYTRTHTPQQHSPGLLASLHHSNLVWRLSHAGMRHLTNGAFRFCGESTFTPTRCRCASCVLQATWCLCRCTCPSRWSRCSRLWCSLRRWAPPQQQQPWPPLPAAIAAACVLCARSQTSAPHAHARSFAPRFPHQKAAPS